MDNAELIAQAEMSPCVGVCKSDELTGWCFGCGRTQEEIANWQTYDASMHENLKEPLAQRVNQLIIKRRADRAANKTSKRRRRT